MKTKITTCFVIALMLLSGLSQAQKRNRAERMQRRMTKLTDTQKEELKAAKVEFAKATLDVKNELNELKVHQRTLMSAEKLDDKKVSENIDKIAALQKQLMKERINMRLAAYGLLDEDQKMHRNMRGDRSNMQGQGLNSRRGQFHKGDRNGQFARGNRSGQMQSGHRNGQFVRGNRTGQMQCGNGNGQFVRGNRSGQMQCGNGNGQFVRGNRSGQMQSGHRNGQFVRGDRYVNALGLSEGQQEQMKSLWFEHQKATQNLREGMQELRLKQKHLLNDETPNKNEISANIDQISKIQNQLAKERILNQKEIRQVLDKDQLVLFLSNSHKMNKHRKGRMQRHF